MNLLLLLIKIVSGIVIGAIIAYAIFLVVTIIDKEITKGSAYGFTIGMPKDEAFNVAKENYKQKEIYVVLPLNHPAYEPDKVILFTETDRLILQPENLWYFSFNKNYPDLLALFFENNKLVKIDRHRKYFELP